jgi:hypothetical protein
MSSALRFLPLQSDTAQRLSGDISRLALVGLKSDEAMGSLFEQIVDPHRIVEIQNEVIEGKKTPLF